METAILSSEIRGKFRSLVSSRLSFHMRGYEQIAYLLLLGIALRVAVSFFTSHPDDEEVWYITGINMLSENGSPYATRYFSYPPVWAYIFLPFLSTLSLFLNPHLLYVRMMNGAVVPVMAPLFNFAVKIPIIIGDVLMGLIIYRIVCEFGNSRSAKRAFALWFLNPLVIYTGAFLAQFDVLAALATLLAFAFFIRKKYFVGGASLSIAIMTKVYPVFLAPFYLFHALKPRRQHATEWRKGFWNSALFVAGGLAIAGVLLIPVLHSGSFHNFVDGIFRRGDYVASIGGPTPLDVLWLFGDPMGWSNEYGRPQQIYTILTALQVVGIAFVIFFLVFRSRQEQDMKDFLRGNVCILVIVLLTNLTVNPQYILWVMPFLIIDYGFYGNYRVRILILSVAGVFLSFYWAYPFHPITVFVNKDVGVMLGNVLNLSLYPSVYSPLVIFFGLLGAATIMLLPFPSLRIRMPRIFSRKHRTEVNPITTSE